MSRTRFLATIAAQVPWTAAQLLTEAALLATVAKRKARAGERPWGERYERISPDWFAGVLRDGGEHIEHSSIKNIALERFGEIGQMSAVFRIRPLYADGTSGPTSLVLKTTTAEMKNRVLNAALGVFERELRSYRLPQPERGLLRPKCWYAAQHRITKSSMLVLDDLADWRGIAPDEKLAPQDAQRVVVAMAVHHAFWWQKTGLAELGFKTTLQTTAATLGPMCLMAWGKARKLMTDFVDADIIELLEAYVKNQHAVCQRIMAGPTTLVHGDLNTNNLFFDDADDRVCAIDWQSTHIGHWAEDLAYLVLMGMSADNSAAYEENLITTHQRALAESGVMVDTAQHRADYALGVFKVGAMLTLAALIIDPQKDPLLYERYKESISTWAIAARRHHLAEVLAEICR